MLKDQMKEPVMSGRRVTALVESLAIMGALANVESVFVWQDLMVTPVKISWAVMDKSTLQKPCQFWMFALNVLEMAPNALVVTEFPLDRAMMIVESVEEMILNRTATETVGVQ